MKDMTITSEMSRVGANGYLFMIVPTMSPLRKYHRERENILLGWRRLRNFINLRSMQTRLYNFENAGFKLCEMMPYGGLKGFKDEVIILKPIL